jgi:hypothetical protein
VNVAASKEFFEECWRPIAPGAECAGDLVGRSYAGLPPEMRELFDAVGNYRGPRHPLSQAFHDLLVKAGEMHDRKQADYGRDDDPFYNIKQSANWGIEPWVGAMMRADDKMGRLRAMAQDGGELVNEPIEDSLMDIAVYALIALVLREESARSGQVALDPS